MSNIGYNPLGTYSERPERPWPKQKWDIGDFVFNKHTGYSFVARVDKTRDYGGGKHIECLLVNVRTGKVNLVGQDEVRPPAGRKVTDREQAGFMRYMLTGECGDGSDNDGPK